MLRSMVKMCRGPHENPKTSHQRAAARTYDWFWQSGRLVDPPPSHLHRLSVSMEGKARAVHWAGRASIDKYPGVSERSVVAVGTGISTQTAMGHWLCSSHLWAQRCFGRLNHFAPYLDLSGGAAGMRNIAWQIGWLTGQISAMIFAVGSIFPDFPFEPPRFRRSRKPSWRTTSRWSFSGTPGIMSGAVMGNV